METALPVIIEGALQKVIPSLLAAEPGLPELATQLAGTATLKQAVLDMATSVQSSHKLMAVCPRLGLPRAEPSLAGLENASWPFC